MERRTMANLLHNLLATYQTVFDASQQGLSWSDLLAPFIGVFIISVGLYWVKNRERLPTSWRGIGPLIAGSMVVLGVYFSFVGTTFIFSAHSQAIQILKEGKASVVEGRVVDLTTTAGGNAESFTVSGEQFEYSEYSNSVGFHHTSTHGGPIKTGLYVRIYYTHIAGDPSEPAILKLEIEG